MYKIESGMAMNKIEKWFFRIICLLLFWFLVTILTDIIRRRTPYEFGFRIDELRERIENLEKVTGDTDHEIVRVR